MEYTPVEEPEFMARLRTQGLPEVAVERITGFLTDIKNGQESTVTAELADWLGRPPTPLKEGVKEIFKL
ncbi:hypothetical protein MUN84_01225 [Hymenobacter sp. 5516J-16]|uniref:hypothetical protein n=1 Tax=Hymenobacter sp. 5516J-16 TaxID=2932253 RepID=UPI001FD19461|nr:hypothetical protein [Hymenobacter sp. 5516J-16]UOQ77370.1 hypothetical protein MUN84_01225 [Hymenobacter sp. 5516J-16]